jgi:phosphoesterase RecJ-like protein
VGTQSGGFRSGSAAAGPSGAADGPGPGPGQGPGQGSGKRPGIGSGGPPTAPDEADWAEVAGFVEAADTVYLIAHVSPDGDALGSALAVGLALRALGRTAFVSFGDDPPTVPVSLGFLPGQDLLVPPGDVPDAPDLVLVFDVASEQRLGLLEGKAKAARRLVVIDHHASNTRFGTHHLIDTAAPATAVLADELVRRLGGELTPEIATALYTGLTTDTGSFKYTGTTPETHEFAARLLATGIRHDLISRTLWDTASFGYLKVLAAALSAAELDRDAAGGLGLVWTVVRRADREAHGVALDEVEGIIDQVRKSAEAEVALVLKEDDEGAWRASSRSKGLVDLGRVCAAMGGGGHAYAAGFTSYDTVESTVTRFRALLDTALIDTD